ncbi:MAG: hypothetical protein U0840_21980 [Gemmataceae bacterium]
MYVRRAALALVLLGLAVSLVQAERPPEQRSRADAVVVGTVGKVTPKTDTFGSDGVKTTYTATIEVKKVEKGEDIKQGDTIKVTWFAVTKAPSNPFPGAYGQKHALKPGTAARIWLMGSADKGFTIIYNRDGVELQK